MIFNWVHNLYIRNDKNERSAHDTKFECSLSSKKKILHLQIIHSRAMIALVHSLYSELWKMVCFNNLRTSLLDPPKRDITIQVWPLIKSRGIIAHDSLINTNVN